MIGGQVRKFTIEAGGIGGLSGGAIDEGVFRTTPVTTPGIAATKCLGMSKPKTAIALYRRSYNGVDFK